MVYFCTSSAAGFIISLSFRCLFLLPAKEVCKSYVFAGVCLSRGGCAWQRGACMVKGGMRGEGGHVW